MGRHRVGIVNEELSGKSPQGVERGPLHRIAFLVDRALQEDFPDGQHTGPGLGQLPAVIPVFPGSPVYIEVIREQGRVGMYYPQEQLLGGFMH